LPILYWQKAYRGGYCADSHSVCSRASAWKPSDLYWTGQDTYAKFLHALGPILCVIRIFLLAAFVTHIVATIQLAQENRVARPQKYAVAHYERSTIASRTMLVSGLIVLCFVIYRILQFTLQVTDPKYHELYDSSGGHDVYRIL
jgi:succinate dehydrogenase / fumarate reductase cytochrome b subunit